MSVLPSIQVIAKGEHWFAINKPAGISVHNEKGGDVVSAFPQHENLFLLNRLDAAVSGIVLLATNKSTASAIQAQFADRSVTKQYAAIALLTAPLEDSAERQGIWKKPLTKKAENRNKPAGWAGKRVPCETLWSIEKVEEDKVYLQLNPVTGRKHQLRRHAAMAGWPLLGDSRYGPEDLVSAAENAFIERIALHARNLIFIDPETNLSKEVVCPAPW